MNDDQPSVDIFTDQNTGSAQYDILFSTFPSTTIFVNQTLVVLDGNKMTSKQTAQKKGEKDLLVVKSSIFILFLFIFAQLWEIRAWGLGNKFLKKKKTLLHHDDHENQ